jgi:hypothetical protein
MHFNKKNTIYLNISNQKIKSLFKFYLKKNVQMIINPLVSFRFVEP